MKVNVKLYGRLRDRVPREQKGKAELSLAATATVADALAELGIDDPVLVAVNEMHESAESHQLNDGDKIAIFELTAGG